MAAAAEEDTELRDLLVQTLESSGVLNKIKVGAGGAPAALLMGLGRGGCGWLSALRPRGAAGSRRGAPRPLGPQPGPAGRGGPGPPEPARPQQEPSSGGELTAAAAAAAGSPEPVPCRARGYGVAAGASWLISCCCQTRWE